MGTPLLQLRGVRRDYAVGGEVVRALRGIDLDIEKGDSVAIIGASGSGKSTLMHIVGCLDQPSDGLYSLNGEDVSAISEPALARIRNRQIGFVFQSFNLLPRVNALANVMQPLAFRGVPLGERRERALHALDRVGLSTRANHLPSQLSGGQKQRVSIARALCAEPSIMIADEPTGNLDSQTSHEILSLLLELNDAGHTLIVVTHEADIAARLRRCISLKDGRIERDEVRSGC